MTKRSEPVWLDDTLLTAIHEMQLAEHGGLPGLRDAGLLVSALARPQQLWHHGQQPPFIAALAAAYAYGIARNHPFADGNKRCPLVAMETFLNLNGWELNASNAECVHLFMALAAGDIDEAGFASWLSERLIEAG